MLFTRIADSSFFDHDQRDGSAQTTVNDGSRMKAEIGCAFIDIKATADVRVRILNQLQPDIDRIGNVTNRHAIGHHTHTVRIGNSVGFKTPVPVRIDRIGRDGIDVVETEIS